MTRRRIRIYYEQIVNKCKIWSKQIPKRLWNPILSARPDPPAPEQKKYSNNEALNQVLNETVGGIPQEGASVSSGSDQVTDFHGQAVDVEELPDHVSNALTRNYSDVLKLVDKKVSTERLEKIQNQFTSNSQLKVFKNLYLKTQI